MAEASKTSKLWEEFKHSVGEFGLFSTITGSEATQQWKPLQARFKALPKDYQEVYMQVSASYWGKGKGGVFDNRADVDFFADLLDMLEEGVLDGIPAKNFVGEESREFVQELTQTDAYGAYREKWRKNLNATILKKLGRNE